MSDPDSVYKQLAITGRALDDEQEQHKLTKKALASATADVERLQKRVEELERWKAEVFSTVARIARYMRGNEIWEYGLIDTPSNQNTSPASLARDIILK